MATSPVLSNGHPSFSHSDLGQRMESFHRSDQERNRLLHELVSNYDQLQHRSAELYADLQNEQRSRREWQQRAMELERKVTTLSRMNDAGPRVAVLIDGDGAPFLDEIYAAGEEGGSDAAYRLNEELRKRIAAIFPNESTSHWNVIVNIFVNTEGLNAKLHACGLMAPNVHLEKLGRAFSSAQTLFQFTSVKPGKEQADYKLRSWFQMHLKDIQCRHIILGGICHDTGYLPMLEPLKHDAEASTRVSLLATLPAQSQYKSMQFKPMRIPTVFRAEHLPSKPTGASKSFTNIEATMPQRTISKDSVMDASNGVPLPSSSPAPSSDSWARVSKASEDGTKEFTISTKKNGRPNQKKFIIYNKENHRLDAPIPYADKASQDKLFHRIKAEGKICNKYHLTGKCSGGCGFVHGEKISGTELQALKYRARTRPCQSKGFCADYDCTMGHTCPYTQNCQGKGCAFEDAHGVDLTPAYKWYEDDQIEMVGTAPS